MELGKITMAKTSLMLNWIIRMEQFVTQSCSQANGAKTYMRMAKFDKGLKDDRGIGKLNFYLLS